MSQVGVGPSGAGDSHVAPWPPDGVTESEALSGRAEQRDTTRDDIDALIRDSVARDVAAEVRDRAARERDAAARAREEAGTATLDDAERDRAAAALDRFEAANDRDASAADREALIRRRRSEPEHG